MAKNDGKAFEKIIRKQFKEIPNVSVDRINDNVGYHSAYNIADLIVYRKPYKYYIECKCVRGTSFPFSSINKNALEDLQYQSIINGVGCYFIIWFIELEKTICISATEIYTQLYVRDKKSIGVSSFDEFDYMVVNGTKKRKFYNYDLTNLLDKLDGEMA